MKSDSILPSYPRAKARGNQVLIIQEDGRSSLWGTERSNYVAKRAADDIQLSLRAINYVKKAMVKKINEISDDLVDAGIPEEYVGHFILEGYESIKETIVSLNELHLYENNLLDEG
jgi:hypothetical protein